MQDISQIEQPVPTINSETPSINIFTKAQQVEKKKKRFYRSVFIIVLSIIFSVALVGSAIFLVRYINSKKPVLIIKDDTTNTEPTDTGPVDDTNGKVLYKDDRYLFQFEFNKEDKLIAPPFATGQNDKAEIIYKDAVPTENTNEQNLENGYIFRVTPLTLSNTNITNVANIKRNTLISTCPSTATVTAITKSINGNLEGNMFEVENCGANYVIRYVFTNGYMYEILQVYKGDLGFKQTFKSVTEDMIRSLKFTSIISDIPVEPYILNEVKKFFFSFKYPREFDTACCIAPKPPYGKSQLVLNLVEPTPDGTPIDNKDFKGLGIFAETTPNFETYVQNQKQMLIDNYKIIKGVDPITTDSTIQVAGVEGLLLQGYAWSGETFILVKHPTKSIVITISNTGITDENLNLILSSFEFKP